jgi:hypothetical protein
MIDDCEANPSIINPSILQLINYSGNPYTSDVLSPFLISETTLPPRLVILRLWPATALVDV